MAKTAEQLAYEKYLNKKKASSSTSNKVISIEPIGSSASKSTKSAEQKALEAYLKQRKKGVPTSRKYIPDDSVSYRQEYESWADQAFKKIQHYSSDQTYGRSNDRDRKNAYDEISSLLDTARGYYNNYDIGGSNGRYVRDNSRDFVQALDKLKQAYGMPVQTSASVRKEASAAVAKRSPDQRVSASREADVPRILNQLAMERITPERIEMQKKEYADLIAKENRISEVQPLYTKDLDEQNRELDKIRNKRREISTSIKEDSDLLNLQQYDRLASQPDFAKYSAAGRSANTSDTMWNMVNRTGIKADDSLGKKLGTAVILSGSAEIDEAINYLSDKQRSIYNYLYAKEGKAAADEYINKLTPSLMKTRAQVRERTARDVATDGFVGATAAAAYSIAQTPYSGYAYLSSVAQSAAGQTPNTNDYLWDAVSSKNTIRDTQAQAIERKTLDKTGSQVAAKGASMVYGAFMSILDSQYSAMLFGGMGSANLTKVATLGTMGAEAAASGYKQLTDEGIEPDRAMAAATFQGIAEALFEVASLENAIDVRNAAEWGSLVKNLLRQAGLEGSEEVFTELSNTLTDALILGRDSEWTKTIEQYMSGGMSRSKATGLAALDVVKKVGAAFIGGAMGGAFGSVVDTAIGSYNQSSAGSSVMRGDTESANDVKVADALIKDGLASDNKYVRALAEKMQADSSAVTERNIGRLMQGLKEAGSSMQNSQEADSAQRVERALKAIAAARIENEENGSGAEYNGRVRAVSYDTGDRIDIGDIDSIVDGVALIDTNEGVKSVNDIDFDNEDIGVLYDNAGRMSSVKAAQAYVSNYDVNSDVSLEQYTQAFNSLYRAAENGLSYVDAVGLVAQSWLTENQRQSIYAAAVGGSVQQQVKAPAQRKPVVTQAPAQGTTAKVIKLGKNAKVGLHISFSKTDLSPELREVWRKNKTQIHVMDAVAKQYGASIYVVDTLKGKQLGSAVINSDVNGAYDPNTNTIYVAADAQAGALAYIAYHELTHMIKRNASDAYSSLESVVRGALEAQGENFDNLVKHQMNLNSSLSKAAAIEEVIANTVPTVLTDDQYVQELLQKDEAGFMKIKRFVTELLQTLRKAFGDLTKSASWRQDAELAKHVDQLRAIEEALNRAQQAMTMEFTDDVARNESGKPVAVSDGIGGLKLSEKTYEEGGRDTLEGFLRNQVASKELDQADMDDILQQTDRIYKIMQNVGKGYQNYSNWAHAEVDIDPVTGQPVFSVIKANGEYAMNLDFSLVCKKRRPLNHVLNEMVARGIVNNFDLDETQIVRINDVIREYGLETACPLCFVDAKRFRQAKVADAFVYMFNRQVRSLAGQNKNLGFNYFNFGNDSTLTAVAENSVDKLKDSDLDFSYIDKILAGGNTKSVAYKIADYLKNNANGRMLVSRGDFMSTNGFENLKKNNQTLLSLYNSKKGSGGPKASFGDVQYLNDVIRDAKFVAKAAYDVGGVRIQSFSDFVPRMVFDYVQMIADMSAKQLPSHAYTKEHLFVKIFGKTGLKINMSLVPAVVQGAPAGLNPDGSYAWAKETFPYDEAVRIMQDPEYDRNCGTICVGVSDEHIRKLMTDPTIRMIIPYHRSSINPLVAMMNNIKGFSDYTKQQSTRYKSTGKKLSKADLKKEFNFNARLHELGANGDPRAVVEEYVRWCEDNGYIPKFDKFAYTGEVDANGQKVVDPNYYKLIIDFSVYDSNGNYTPQGPVRTIYPDHGSTFGSAEDLIVTGLGEDQEQADMLRDKTDAIVNSIEEVLTEAQRESEDLSLSAKDPVEVTNDLIAVHNLSGEQLQGIIDLGGFPMPSIAVMRMSQGHDRYGDVSIVFGRETIDPDTNPRNKVYGGDAWTPTFPTVEYEASEKASKRISDKYYELYGKFGYDIMRPMYGLMSEPDSELTKAGGETALINSFADDTGMMQIFLADSGKKPIETVTKEEVTRLDDETLERSKFIISKIGESTIKDISPKNGEAIISARKRWASENIDSLKSALKEFMIEWGYPESDVADVISEYSDQKLIHDFILPARNYLKNGAETRRTVQDYKATENAIRNATSKDAYMKWLHGLLDGIEKGRGIWNGKERYNRNGDERSFKSLHYEYNLENIVRAMRNDTSKGSAGFAGLGLFGLATKDYQSIDDVRADVQRLRRSDDGEYEREKEKFSNRLLSIADEIKPVSERNTFIALDEATQAILDSVRRGKTKAGISKILSKEYDGYYSIKSDTAQKVYDLIKEIEEMPTEYFEAKPERAVGIDEIKAVIVPNGEYVDAIRALEQNGVPVVTYDPNVDGDRIRALNSDPVQRVKFSIKDTDPVDAKKLQRDNKRLQEALDHSNRQLRITNGIDPEERIVRRAARKVLREFSSKYDLDTLTNELMQIYSFAAVMPDNDNRFDEINDVALGVMRKVVDESTEMDTSVSDSLSGLKIILDKGISLNREQRAEVLEAFGTMAAFRKETGVRVTKNGTPLEVAWGEMREAAPRLFDTDGTDMIQTLAYAGTMTKPVPVNPYGYDLDAAAADLWLSVQAEYADVMRKSETYADRVSKKLSDNRKKLADQRLADDIYYGQKASEQKLTDEMYFGRQIAGLKSDIQDLRRQHANEIAAERSKIADQRLADEMHYGKREARLIDKLAEVKATYAARQFATNQQRKERAERSKLMASIMANAKTLLRWSNGGRVLDGMQGPVADILAQIEPSGSDTKETARWDESISRLTASVIRAANAPAEEGGLDFAASLVASLQSFAESANGRKNIHEMSMGELLQFNELMKEVKHTVTTANRLFYEGRWRSRQEAGEAAIEAAQSKKNSTWSKIRSDRSIRQLIQLNSLKPIYFFKELGGSFQRMWDDVRLGQARWGHYMDEARNFVQEADEKYNTKKWLKPDNLIEFTTESGDDITLTIDQALYLYAVDKRENINGTTSHLSTGGFIYGDNRADTRRGLQRLKKRATDAVGHTLSEQDMERLRSMLTEEQMAYADHMVGYLSGRLSAIGNATALKLYGVKRFTESYYIPIQSESDYIEQHDLATGEPGSSTAGEQVKRLKNAGFTNNLVTGANNPFVLRGFREVFGEHTASMLTYATMAVPQDNLFRLLQYQRRGELKQDLGSASVKSALDNAYGKGAQAYMSRLLRDMSGSVVSDSRSGIMGTGLSLFKKGAVMGSLSVVIQQPSAIGRAVALIDPKYFVSTKLSDIKNVARIGALWKEAKQYTGTATIKDIGGFDTGTSRGAASWIVGDDADTFMGRAVNTIDDVLGKGPEYADMVTWVGIWEACKREVADKQGLAYGSEEHLTAAGKRFDDVIDYTQVYDSLLARSDIMRSSNGLTKMATAFMAEPTTSLNMLLDAANHIKDKDYDSNMARTMAAFVLSVILNAALKSIVYAARDDDESKNYIEKYAEQFTTALTGDKSQLIKGDDWVSNIANAAIGFAASSDLSPATLIPFIQDVAEIVSGYDVARTDMNSIAALWKSISNLGNDDKTAYAKWRDFAGSLAIFAGVPLKNVWRDMEGIYRTIAQASGLPYLKDSTKATNTTAKYEKIVELALSDKKSRFRRMEEIRATLTNPRLSKPKTEKEVDEGVAKALSTMDVRISQAYDLRSAGDVQGLYTLRDEIMNDGFSSEIVDNAISIYANSVKKEEKAEEQAAAEAAGVTPEPEPLTAKLYTYDDLFITADIAADSGNYDDLRKALNELLADSNADDPESAARSKAASYYKDTYIQAVEMSDTESASGIKDMLVDVFGVKPETVDGWVIGKHKADIYDMMADDEESHSETELNEMIDMLRADGVSEESIKDSIRYKAKTLMKAALENGDDVLYNRIKQSLKKMELYDAKGNLYFSDKRIEGWFA